MKNMAARDRLAPIKLTFSGLITLAFLTLFSVLTNQAFAQNPQPVPATTVTSETSESPQIHAILVSDEGNTDGYVSQNKTTLPQTKDIFVTIQIAHAVSGDKVIASLVNTSTNLHTKLAENVITKNGNISKAFKFTYEGGSWPTGVYKVNIKLSTGQTDTATFSVEK